MAAAPGSPRPACMGSGVCVCGGGHMCYRVTGRARTGMGRRRPRVRAPRAPGGRPPLWACTCRQPHGAACLQPCVLCCCAPPPSPPPPHTQATKQARGRVDKKSGQKGDRNQQKAVWKEYKYLLVQVRVGAQGGGRGFCRAADRAGGTWVVCVRQWGWGLRGCSAQGGRSGREERVGQPAARCMCGVKSKPTRGPSALLAMHCTALLREWCMHVGGRRMHACQAGCGWWMITSQDSPTHERAERLIGPVEEEGQSP